MRRLQLIATSGWAGHNYVTRLFPDLTKNALGVGPSLKVSTP